MKLIVFSVYAIIIIIFTGSMTFKKGNTSKQRFKFISRTVIKKLIKVNCYTVIIMENNLYFNKVKSRSYGIQKQNNLLSSLTICGIKNCKTAVGTILKGEHGSSTK